MVSTQDRQAVVAKLSWAFYEYRDLPVWLICKREKISVCKTLYRFGGSMHHTGVLKYPGKAPSIGKEETFWHELCHWFLKNVLYRPMRIGYQAMLLEYEDIYWAHERLCDSFADLMLLYRRGIIGQRESIDIEQWLFEDTTSVGYAEVTAGSIRRITKARDEALAAGTNADLSDIDVLLEWMAAYRERVHFQPMLPTPFYEHHQTPGPRFVDEDRDFERQYQFAKFRKSWTWKHPTEQRILKRISSLKAFHDQPALFGEMTEADQAEFKRRLMVLDRYVKKFQKS